MLSYNLPTLWDSAIDAWVMWMQLAGLRPATLKVRRGQVRMIARRSGTNGPAELTFGMIVAISSDAHRRRGWSNEHRKGLRTALNGFYDWAIDNGHASVNPAAALPAVVLTQPRPRPCPDDIWRELLACAPPRERMMVRLAGEVGMRREEVAICHRSDLVHDGVAWSLIVNGKGGKQRVVPITDALADALRAYVRDNAITGFIFPGQIDGHLSAHHVGKLISKLMPPGWSMHKLRHRYATRGYAATGNLRAVQEALGHVSVATTQIYTAVATREVRAVSEGAAWLTTT